MIIISQKMIIIIVTAVETSNLTTNNVLRHNNRLAVEMSNPPNVRRRLKRQWPSDLPQPADDKN
jgi:hypothetical protein